MHKEYLMGNEAIALGALAAGVNLACGYPGTPSTEVLETLGKRRTAETYVEWSVNEKVAMEVAAGAAYAGGRVLVTMKQVGLNVASDPLMCLEYVGIEGGMVVLVADDPGPMSSQTEQDTRRFAGYAKIPCFDPSTPQEAYEMMQEAFDLSEELKTPVLFRPTTRIDHAYAAMEVKDEAEYAHHTFKGFVKDTKRWVIFPALSRAAHAKIETRNEELAERFSDYSRNCVLYEDGGEKGVLTHGAGFGYAREAMAADGRLPLLRIATPYPFPERKFLEFCKGKKEILVLEELDPVLEDAALATAGRYGIAIKILGKHTHHTRWSGENTVDLVKEYLNAFRPATSGVAGVADAEKPKGFTADSPAQSVPGLPIRPPVLCAGCPHRASFYAVKMAMKGQKTIYCGDIGCYTLGNAAPLDMTDTCLCMGAGLGIAQGVSRLEPDTKAFAFVGDSTFFASAVPGVVNALYNGADMTLVVLDNSTTAMTGHQPHPGTGERLMGDAAVRIVPEQVLRGIGLSVVEVENPLDHAAAVETVRRVAAEKGVKAIIFRSPCIAKVKGKAPLRVNPEACVNCKKCIREIGCPGLCVREGRVMIDAVLCTGCGLCAQICPKNAIGGQNG